MINYLLHFKKPLFLVFFHVLLGLVSAISKIPLIFYVYLVLFSALIRVVQIKSDFTYLNLVLVYIVPFEILCRMTKTSPFIPYEFSKYLMLLLLIFGILNGANRGKIGLVLLILLIPSLIFNLSDQVEYKDLIFNLLGPVNLCLSIIYFSRNLITTDQFYLLMRAMLFPLLSTLTFVFIKTPDFDAIEFTLGANFDTTGGFGPNQVSTVFGLGLFLTFYLINRGIKISGSLSVDVGILFLFGLQGLLSFSRGGMIGGVLAILIYFIFNSNKKFKNKIRSKYILPIILIVLGSFFIANEITDGQLVLRYSGETSGTQSGLKDKDINTITTGRASIFEGDLNLFLENPTGVGVGSSAFLRKTDRGALSHTELSRLLAEHGYFGLVFFMILTLWPLFYFFKISYSIEWRGIMLAIFFLAWYSTFHSATRTFVTPLLIGFSLMRVIQVKPLEKRIS